MTTPATPKGSRRAVLTLEQFSEMNRRRCESYHGFGESLQPDSKYTLLAWVASVASEAGEALDAVIGYEGLKERRAGKTREDIAKELADVITYADLAIQKLGLQTADVLVEKFEEVNARLDEGRRFSLAALPEQREAPIDRECSMCGEGELYLSPMCRSATDGRHRLTRPAYTGEQR